MNSIQNVIRAMSSALLGNRAQPRRYGKDDSLSSALLAMHAQTMVESAAAISLKRI